MRYALLLAGAALIAFENPARADVASFGCSAAGYATCYFRIFYAAGGSRLVILPAGLKQNISGVRIGTDSYCLSASGRPAYGCTRKVITDKYNS